MTAALPVGTLRSLLLPVPLSLALLVQVGCGSDGSSSFKGNQPGTEGGACESGSCDEGLECQSNVCVDPDSGSSGTGGDGSSSSGTDGSGGTSSSTSGSSTSNGSDSGGAGGTGGDGSSGSGGSTGGSGGSATDASGGSGGAGTDASGGSGGGGTGGEAGESGQVQCEGSHPNVNDQARTCDAGSCYCAGDPVDTCFPSDTAEDCCDGMLRCGSDMGDRGVDCAGVHPTVTDEARTCEPGSCYCSDGETLEKCLTEDIARICCPSDIELDCVPVE